MQIPRNLYRFGVGSFSREQENPGSILVEQAVCKIHSEYIYSMSADRLEQQQQDKILKKHHKYLVTNANKYAEQTARVGLAYIFRCENLKRTEYYHIH